MVEQIKIWGSSMKTQEEIIKQAFVDLHDPDQAGRKFAILEALFKAGAEWNAKACKREVLRVLQIRGNR